MIEHFKKNERSIWYAFMALTMVLTVTSITVINIAGENTRKGQLEDFKNGEPIRCSGPDSPAHCFMTEGLGQ